MYGKWCGHKQGCRRVGGYKGGGSSRGFKGSHGGHTFNGADNLMSKTKRLRKTAMLVVQLGVGAGTAMQTNLNIPHSSTEKSCSILGVRPDGLGCGLIK